MSSEGDVFLFFDMSSLDQKPRSLQEERDQGSIDDLKEYLSPFLMLLLLLSLRIFMVAS